MKREELTALGVAPELIDKIMSMNGKDIEKTKSVAEEEKSRYETLAKEFEALKTSKMTEEEKLKAKQMQDAKIIEEAKKEKEIYEKKVKLLRVKSVLSASLQEDEINKFAETLIGETEEDTEAKAKEFLSLIKAREKQAADQAKASGVQSIIPPQNGGGEPQIKKPIEVKRFW